MKKGKGKMADLYTAAEVLFLKDNFASMPIAEIAEELGRTESGILGKAKKLKLRRPHNGQFKKGNVPANKGKKFPGQINRTCFKKGNLPHNTLPVGTIITDHYGYLKKKLAHKKWEFLHRLVWIENNGPIPEGMLITFKDGSSLNCSIENLEMIDTVENVLRNSVKQEPEELQEVSYLTRKLNMEINRKWEKK